MDIQPKQYANPRERLILDGVHHLTTEELLAVILGSGIKNRSVFSVSQNILKTFQNPKKLYQCGIRELCHIEGIGLANACRIKAAIEFGLRAMRPDTKPAFRITRPEIIFERYRELALLDKEVFVVVLLDVKNRILAERKIAQGNLAECPIVPREIFEFALRESAYAVILVHNHPSGDATPSNEDILLTRKLTELGKMLGISILDHVVISENTFCSIQ